MAVNVGELEAVLKLKDQLSPGLKKAQGGLSSMMGGLTKFAAVAGTAAAAVAVVTKALNAQSTQVEAVNSLNIALANQGNLLEGTSQSLQDYASQLQKVTKYGDEEVLQLQANLASYGMNEEQIKRTTAATLDLASAKGIDLRAASDLLGKAFVGETGTLSRYGIVIQKGLNTTQKFEAALGQVENRFKGQARAAAETFTGRMKQLSNALGDTWEALGKLFGSLTAGSDDAFPTIIGWVESLTNFIGSDLVLAIGELRARWIEMGAWMAEGAAKIMDVLGKLPARLGGDKFAGYAEKLREAAAGQRDLAGGIRETTNKIATSVGATKDVTNGVKQHTQATKENTEALKLEQAQLQNTLAAWEARDAEFKQAYEAAQEVADSLGLLTPEQSKAAKAAAQHAYELGNKLATDALKAGRSLESVRKSLEGMGLSARDVDAIMERLGNTMEDAGERAGKSFMDGFKEMMDGLADTIVGAIMGGGDVFEAAGSFIGSELGKGLGNMLGDLGGSIGGTIGGFMSPLGAIAGKLASSLIGKGIGALGGLFSNKELEKVNDMRDAFFEAADGYDGFVQQLAESGVVGEEARQIIQGIYDAKTVEEYERAVQAANDKMAEGMEWMQLQTQAEDDLQAAIEKYGFSIEELGPKWRQQELDKQAAQLLKEYELLTASGIDQGLVLDKMGENMTEYIQTAIKAGVAVPEAMRPMIEAAIANGEILDENGNAYASAEEAGITFAKTMTESMQEVVDSIKDLVAALTGVKPPPITIPVHYDYGGGGGGREYNPGDRDGDPTTPFADGGIVTSPTVGLVGESGPEAIIPLQGNGTLPGSGGDMEGAMRRLGRELKVAFRDAINQMPQGS